MARNKGARSFETLKTLLPFAETDRQRTVIQAVMQHGSMGKAAVALKCDIAPIVRSIALVEGYAKRRGYDPEHDQTHPVPVGQYAAGVSTLYDEEGKVRLQWVKSHAEQEEREKAFREAVDAFKEDVPRAKPVSRSKSAKRRDLMNVHVLTDYHLGMKAWHEEAGEDWDLKIAEDLLTRWFDFAIDKAPPAELGVLAQLGDFLHFDSLEAVTPTNRHLLDADTRYQKMVRVAIRSLRRIIAAMLAKYDKVHILMADANHDPAGSAWLREMFAAFYQDEPRITVDNSADTYYCLEFGKTLTLFHHGHKRKPNTIDTVLVAKFREQFGRCKYVYCHMGHLHHIAALETNLMVVEQHRTMAAKDAWASSNGFMSGRGAPVITYSREFGEVGRLCVNPEMVSQ